MREWAMPRAVPAATATLRVLRFLASRTSPGTSLPAQATRPSLAVVAELLKPITWFPPMWAFGCGVVASGAALSERCSPMCGCRC